MVIADAGDRQRGITLLERAVKAQPGVVVWYSNLCTLYRLEDRTADALAAGQEAVRLDPQNPDRLVNLSRVFANVDDYEHSIACLQRALDLKPEHADAHFMLGQNLLATGQYERGWVEYEWRHRTEVGKGALPKMMSAPWNGMPIPHGRLLLVGDQGYGDTIQFARYIPLAAEMCQELILGCSPELAPILSSIPGVTRCYHRLADVPDHAAHCALSSVPGLVHTTLDTIPAQVPYLFANPAQVAEWRKRLDAALPRGVRRIGLSWAGRPAHADDSRRSMRLARLAPLAGAGHASFVLLQKPVPPADLHALRLFPGLTDIANDLTDFGETAAVIANLDLVITVDTAMGHLSGALGKPVWIMLSKACDWRWLLERRDSPWYPTARLFRQQTPGGWDPVIDEVATALTNELRDSAGEHR